MAMGSMAWGTKKPANKNANRTGWNGVRPGDTVTLRYGDTVQIGLLVSDLHSLARNSCTVIDRRKRKFAADCNWLTVTRKVEDKQ